jgi:S-DNA-T family DNA segregation ATPase FtsK/SpoIIIE
MQAESVLTIVFWQVDRRDPDPESKSRADLDAELLEPTPKRSASRLTLALGKTIHGEPFVSDLATMPHLLIAGSTGQGKSVSVNAMLSSILFRATPDDVRLIMIDPKRLELGMYEDIPHLLTPVVVDPKLAANALKWAVREMEERYKTLAAVGVRNIEQFNRNFKLAQAESKGPVLDPKGNEIHSLPSIVVLIDELADLMMVASNEVGNRSAGSRRWRAVGIHLILAAAALGGRHHGSDQGQPARAPLVPRVVEDRLADGPHGNGAEQLPAREYAESASASSRFVQLHGPYIPSRKARLATSCASRANRPTTRRSPRRTRRPPPRRSSRRTICRRGRAHRGVERSGVGVVPAAAARIGFSRVARRHDGSGDSVWHFWPPAESRASPRETRLLR